MPQGSILDPLLFIVYNADFVDLFYSYKYHMYADDIQMHMSIDSKDTLSMVLDLQIVYTWTDKKLLVLNALKSNFILLDSKNQIKNMNPLTYLS